MISHNKIIGSIVYRTRVALNVNPKFIELARKSHFGENSFIREDFSLWHYPGTSNEISMALLNAGKNLDGGRYKFPSVFNFQPVKQQLGKDRSISFNLAFVAPTMLEWSTEQREVMVFDPILRPIYKEFFNQLKRSGYFVFGYGDIPHNYFEVFTTNANGGVLIEKYGDYVDGIEIHNLSLTLKPNLCDRHFKQIDEENNKVTENIYQILKS